MPVSKNQLVPGGRKFPMTPPTFSIIRTIAGALLILAAPAYADPLLSSWYTANSTKYASIYESTSAEASKTVNTSWSGQTYPTYAGVHEIDYSSSWVYIKNTGMPGQVIGPWSNPNLPKNQGSNTTVYRFPRTPVVVSGTTGKTLTGMGAIGFFVDGILTITRRGRMRHRMRASAPGMVSGTGMPGCSSSVPSIPLTRIIRKVVNTTATPIPLRRVTMWEIM